MYNFDNRDLSVIAEEIENSLVKKYSTDKEKRIKLARDKDKCYDDYKRANTGDRAENAPLEEAIREMKKVNVDIRVCENNIVRLRNVEDLSFIEKIGEVDANRKLRKYNSTGVISIYSTIRVIKKATNEMENEEEFIFRIYPDNISDPDIGVIAANTSLAIACMGKTVGDKAIISSGPFHITYVIKDVY